MNKTILTVLGITLIGLSSYSQGISTIDVSSEKLYMSSDASKPIDAFGSPYVNEDFLPVKVKGYDNQIFTGRYNAYNGEMEVNLGTKVIALDSNKSYEVMFTMDNKIYRTYNYTTLDGIAKRGFLNIVSENDSYELLKQEIVEYQGMVPAATSYQRDKPAKFTNESPNYYVKIGDIVRPLPVKKKYLLKAYPKDSKRIKSFLKENNISLKKEQDLIRLAEFLGNL